MSSLTVNCVCVCVCVCRFGRKAILVWSYLQLAVLGSFTALSPNYTVFCSLRFLCGMSVSGIILNTVSLSNYLSVCLSVCLSPLVTACLSVCLSVSAIPYDHQTH